MARLLLTHPGQAHLDDFLSAAVAIATDPGIEVIERREPTEQELADPAVLVLDVGGQWDPELANYDHHQLGRDERAECALSLFARSLSYRGESVFDALSTQKWFESLRVMDSKGPFQLAKQLETSPDVVFRLLSPVEAILVGWFGEVDRIEQSDELTPMWGLLRQIGRDLLDHAVDVLQRIIQLQSECRPVECCGVQGFILESEDTTALAKWREKFAPTTAFSIICDDRGPGWSLFRYDDDERIDFSRLNGRDDIVFAHAGGFIAKTAGREQVSLEQALELVKLAIVTS